MIKKWLIGVSSVVGGLGVGLSAFAEADTDVLAASASVITTLKENVLGVITANIANIAIVAAAIIAIFVVFKLFRRMIGR